MRNMVKIALVTLTAIVLPTFGAQAKYEKQVTRTVYELSDFPELKAKAEGVCKGKAVMSDKLKTACQIGNFPSVTKSGAFRNTGIGAELNSLMRQTSETNSN